MSSCRWSPSHEVHTVQSQGWKGIKNGRLLRLAREAGFEVFLTSDRGIEFEQNLSVAGMAIVMFVAHSNRLEHLQPLVPTVEKRLARIGPGSLVKVVGSQANPLDAEARPVPGLRIGASDRQAVSS